METGLSLSELFCLPCRMALLYLPVNRLDSFACEEGVRLAEVLAAEEPTICRKRARVGGGEDEVPAVRGNQGLLLDGETAPEHEHGMRH